MTWEEAVRWLRAQPQRANLVRACFFDDPLSEAAERYSSCCEWIAVRALIGPARGAALDLGAGRGISTYALARDGWRVTALEPDPSDLVGAGAIRALASQTGIAVDIVEGWGEDLPFENGTFDLVHGRQVLHHASDLQRLMREVGRVLKPGGRFLATREHVISKREDREDFLALHSLHSLYGGENAYLLHEYLDAIRGGGISIERCLNPLASDINTFPETRANVMRRLAAKSHWPIPDMLPYGLLTVLGALRRNPGRLYSFVGTKRG